MKALKIIITVFVFCLPGMAQAVSIDYHAFIDFAPGCGCAVGNYCRLHA